MSNLGFKFNDRVYWCISTIKYRKYSDTVKLTILEFDISLIFISNITRGTSAEATGFICSKLMNGHVVKLITYYRLQTEMSQIIPLADLDACCPCLSLAARS